MGCCYEVCRSARQDRKRRKQRSRAGSAGSGSQRWPGYGSDAAPLTTGGKSVGFKKVGDTAEEKRPNGTHKASAVATAKDYKPLNNADSKDKKSAVKGLD